MRKLRSREKRFERLVETRPPAPELRRRAAAGSVEWLMPEHLPVRVSLARPITWMGLLVPRSVEALDRQTAVTRGLRGGVLVGTSVLVLVFGLGWGREAGRAWKMWRSNDLLRQAEDYFEGGDYGTGFARANMAYLGCPRNIDAIRCLAHRCGEARSPASLFFFSRLEALGCMSTEDSIARAAALMKCGRPKEAQALVVPLLNAGNQSRLLVETGCELESAGYAMPPVLKTIVGGRIVTNAGGEEKLTLALAWLKSGDIDEHTVAEKALRDLSDAGGGGASSRKAAAALLEELEPGDPATCGLVWRVTEDPEAGTALLVKALERLVAREPHRADERLNSVITDWDGAPLEDRVQLGRMVFRCAKPQLLIGLFERDEAVKDPRVAELYVACLMSHGRLDESIALLKDQGLPVTRGQRAYAEAALCARSGGGAAERRHRLLCALVAASAEANPNLLVGVAELAQQSGLPAVAVRAYQECGAIRGAEVVSLDGLIAIYEATGDTKNLLSVASRASKLWPDNERYQEKRIYACLLLGQDMESAFFSAEKLRNERPADELRNLLLSMAHARMGDTVVCRYELRKLCARGGIPARYRAVIGGLLKGVGDSDGASRVIQGVTENDVALPEEKALLQLARL